MTGVTVEEHELGEQSIVTPLGVLEHDHRFLDGKRLADRPHLDAVPHALAFLPVFVDLEVRRFDHRERVELEAHPWMPCTHDPMGNDAIAIAELPPKS